MENEANVDNKVNSESVEIFFCYARNDQALLNDLKTRLIPLMRLGFVRTWHDTDISPGADWEKEIRRHLDTAHIILLLVSPDFMASEYCYSNEMARAMERHEGGEAHVIPVLLRSIYWQGAPFGKLQALPTDAQPVTRWQDRDEALFDIAEGIRQIVEELVVEKTINELGEILKSEQQKTLLEQVNRLRSSLISRDINFIKRVRIELEQIFHETSENIYLQLYPNKESPHGKT